MYLDGAWGNLFQNFRALLCEFLHYGLNLRPILFIYRLEFVRNLAPSELTSTSHKGLAILVTVIPNVGCLIAATYMECLYDVRGIERHGIFTK